MSVYIPGMEMPKRGHTVTLTILGGGEVCVQYYDCKPHLTVPIVYRAIPVPDHGRLIDADALTKQIKRDGIRSDPFVKIVCDYFNDAPTIIPADKEETT